MRPTSTVRTISGDEAARLYGINGGTADPLLTPTVVGGSWFPREAWVTASMLPYEDSAPIRILPVYSTPSLDVGGTWLGDLPEGARVQLYGVNQTGRSCYIEGDTVQGRQVEGWAACNRLLFHEPTAVPTPGNE